MTNKDLFERLTPSIILNDVLAYIDNCVETLNHSEFQFKKLCIVGSRLNGTHKEDSDLDIALSYSGDLREDDCFNLLNENPLIIEGIRVDFSPYSLDRGNDILFEQLYYVLHDEAEEENILYDEETLMELVKTNTFLKFVYNDLAKRKASISDVLWIIFNSYILKDYIMESLYKNLKRG